MVNPSQHVKTARLELKAYESKGKYNAHWYDTAAKVISVVTSLGIIALMGYTQFGSGFSIWAFFGTSLGVSIISSIVAGTLKMKATSIQQKYQASKLFLNMQEHGALNHHPSDLATIDKRVYQHVRHQDVLNKEARESIAERKRWCDSLGIEFDQGARYWSANFASTSESFSKYRELYKTRAKEFVNQFPEKFKPSDVKPKPFQKQKVERVDESTTLEKLIERRNSLAEKAFNVPWDFSHIKSAYQVVLTDRNCRFEDCRVVRDQLAHLDKFLDNKDGDALTLPHASMLLLPELHNRYVSERAINPNNPSLNKEITRLEFLLSPMATVYQDLLAINKAIKVEQEWRKKYVTSKPPEHLDENNYVVQHYRNQLAEADKLISKLEIYNHPGAEAIREAFATRDVDKQPTPLPLKDNHDFIVNLKRAVAAIPEERHDKMLRMLELKAIGQHLKHFEKDLDFCKKFLKSLNITFNDETLSLEHFEELKAKILVSQLELDKIEALVKDHDLTAPLYATEIKALQGEIDKLTEKEIQKKYEAIQFAIGTEKVWWLRRLYRGFVRSFDGIDIERFTKSENGTQARIQELIQKHDKSIYRTKMASIISINLVAMTALGIACAVVPSAPLFLGTCAALTALGYVSSAIDSRIKKKARAINKLRMVEYLRGRKPRHILGKRSLDPKTFEYLGEQSFEYRVAKLGLDGEPTQARQVFGHKPKLLHRPHGSDEHIARYLSIR